MKNKEKLVPKLRFPEFEDQWRYKKLEEVTDCLDTKRKPLNSEERLKKQGTIPYYGANGIVDYINDYIFNERLILLAEDGGNFFEFENKPIAQKIFGKSWVNNHAHVLRPRDINFDYLFYNLVHKDIRKYINGGTRLKLNQSDMLRIKISIPSLPEQEKIGKFFSTIDKKLDLQRERIEELKSYKKGMMQRIFDQEIRFKDEDGRDYPDWEEKKIRDLGSVYTGKTPSTKERKFWNGDIPFITPTDINSKYTMKTQRYLTEQGSKKSVLIPENSLLITSIASIGKNTINKQVSSCNQQINYIEVNENNSTEFLYYKISYIKNKLLSFAGQTATKILNKREFEDIDIVIPSLPEQEKIANFLSAIDRRIELEEEKLELYEDFKKGLMQRMFV